MTNNVTLCKIQGAIESAGGEIFVVGGAVRDMVLGREPKDIDFLVRNLSLEQISNIVGNIGKSGEVGKAFGIVKGVVDSAEFDFAIPRTNEVKTGDKHTDFCVHTDPIASVEDDLLRRDFRMNAMALPLRDFISRNLDAVIDPHRGIEDLNVGVIRAVGNPRERFSEDPLRILRICQFSARFGFSIDCDTINAISDMRDMLKSVSGERILEEFKKAWTKGNADAHVFIDLLDKTGVGKLLFGNDFSPQPIMLDSMPLKDSEDIVAAQMVAFFLKGGNLSVMKPEAIHSKILDVAKKTFFTDAAPFTFIGNMKPTLPILLNVALELDEAVAEKVRKMMNTPLTAKELAVGGEEIASFLGVKPGKEIGEAQRVMLSALWDGRVNNNREELLNLVAANIKK